MLETSNFHKILLPIETLSITDSDGESFAFLKYLFAFASMFNVHTISHRSNAFNKLLIVVPAHIVNF